MSITEFDIRATDRKNLQDSERSNLLAPIVDEYQFANTTSSASMSATLEHNLGYIPLFVAYFSRDGVYYYKMPYQEEIGGTFIPDYYDAYNARVDEKKLYLSVSRQLIPDGSGSTPIAPNIIVKYYIFRERI